MFISHSYFIIFVFFYILFQLSAFSIPDFVLSYLCFMVQALMKKHNLDTSTQPTGDLINLNGELRKST